jgi:hypothetical protein
MDLMIDCQPPAMSYRRAEVLALPFKRRYEKIEIMPEVSCCPFTLKSLLSTRVHSGHCQSLKTEGRKEHRPPGKLCYVPYVAFTGMALQVTS